MQGGNVTSEFADWTIVLGRFMLGAFFAYGGITHFLALDPITQAMEDRGVPQPRLVLIAGSLFQIVFGLLLAFGISVPAAAIALIAFTVVASLMLVDFWNRQEPARMALRNVFLSNLAIIGGLLIAAGTAG